MLRLGPYNEILLREVLTEYHLQYLKNNFFLGLQSRIPRSLRNYPLPQKLSYAGEMQNNSYVGKNDGQNESAYRSSFLWRILNKIHLTFKLGLNSIQGDRVHGMTD